MEGPNVLPFEMRDEPEGRENETAERCPMAHKGYPYIDPPPTIHTYDGIARDDPNGSQDFVVPSLPKVQMRKLQKWILLQIWKNIDVIGQGFDDIRDAFPQTFSTRHKTHRTQVSRLKCPR